MLRKGFILNLNAVFQVSFPDPFSSVCMTVIFTLHFHDSIIVNTKWKSTNEMGNKVTARQCSTQDRWSSQYA